MDLILAGLGIVHVFGSKMGSEDVDVHKPAPQVYLRSAGRLGAAVSSCLVFEDSHAGVTAGLAAGMDVVGVLSSHTADELPQCKAYIDAYKVADLASLLTA